MPRRRDPNIQASPCANDWMHQHADAAKNLKRVIKLLVSHYVGDAHGYINRASNEVEYRFDPVAGDSISWTIQLVARTKHVVVRFPLRRPRLRGRWRSTTLKNARGEDYPAVDFSIRSGESLASLEAFIKTTRTFARAGVSVNVRAPAGKHDKNSVDVDDPGIRTHRFNIGFPTKPGQTAAWWAENIDRGVITAGFNGEATDPGERHLLAMTTGDWVLAYIKRYGYVGAGRVLGRETYVLHERTPAGSHSTHRHERGVRWLYVIRNLSHAVSLKEAGIRAPRHTRELVNMHDARAAAHLIELLRDRGDRRAGPTRPQRNLIDEALAAAEKEVEKHRPPIDSEEDARQRVLQGVVVRRGQGAFRKVLIKAYQGACAVTGCTTEDVLEAAHIIPYLGAHTNRPDNGLLLRADVHTLFDLGRLWVDADLRVYVADELRQTDYGKLHGRTLRLPALSHWRPHVEHLREHARIAQQTAKVGLRGSPTTRKKR